MTKMMKSRLLVDEFRTLWLVAGGSFMIFPCPQNRRLSLFARLMSLLNPPDKIDRRLPFRRDSYRACERSAHGGGFDGVIAGGKLWKEQKWHCGRGPKRA